MRSIKNASVPGQKTVTVSICPSQIPQGLVWDRNWASSEGPKTDRLSHETALTAAKNRTPISSPWSSHGMERTNTGSPFLPLGTEQLLLGACTDNTQPADDALCLLGTIARAVSHLHECQQHTASWNADVTCCTLMAMTPQL